MNRHCQFHWCAVTFLCVVAGSRVMPQEAQAQTSRKPNIIVIVWNDVGNVDVGVRGCKDIPTPHIDSIAK